MLQLDADRADEPRVRVSSAVGVRIWAGALFAAALTVRLAVVALTNGGPTGNVGYDQGVYYASADALLSGRLPYRDFMLIHPPGLMLFLTPFAAIGRATNDLTGFVLADFAATVVGAVNAVLVFVIGRRLGLSTLAAGIGGCFYAVWWGVVAAEFSARLEPFGNLAFLCGVALLLTPPDRRRRWPLLAGAAFGLAASIKIWWSLPLLLLLLWQLARPDGRRRAALAAAGAIGAAVVIDGPFFLAAPSAMWHMVVLDQLGRARTYPPLKRIDGLTTLDFGGRILLTDAQGVVVLGFVVTAALLFASAWRVAAVRPLLVVGAAEFLLLMFTPRYYSYYGAFLAPTVALGIGAAAQSQHGRRLPRLGPAVAGLVTVGVTLSTAVGLSAHVGDIIPRFPTDRLADAVGPARCVMSDSQMALIELNVLSRDLNRGCADWVDVVARAYGPDEVPGHPQVSRFLNIKWQEDLRRYLLSGQAAITIYPIANLDAFGRRAIDVHPVLASAGGYTLYDTAAPPLRPVHPARRSSRAARAHRPAAPDRDRTTARSATEAPFARGTSQ